MSTTFLGRKEDQRLLTGKGQFTDDWTLPGQLHAVFLRSDRAHAEIVRLDLTAAKAMPGVVAILTQDDIIAANLGMPPSFAGVVGRGGSQFILPPRDLFARDRVRYVGNLIAMVVAESVHQAQDAVEQIEIDYRDLPVVVDAAAALRADAPQLYPEIPNNIVMDYEHGDEAAVVEIFATAPHIVDAEIDNTRVIVNPMEPNACIAAWNESAARYEVYRPTQGTNFALRFMMGYFGEPADKYRIVAKDVGGSFGTRPMCYPEYVAVMIAAKTVGRPVKWVSTRAETMVSDLVGRSVVTRGRLAVDNDGRFLAVRYDWTLDTGFYPGDLACGGTMRNAIFGAIGPYKIPAIYGRFFTVVTNTGCLGAYRGAGRPEMTMNLEQLVDAAALKLGLDQFEIRRRNLIARDQFPYKTPLNVTYDSGDHPGLADKAEATSGWKDFESRRREAGARGKVRGIGCSTYLEAAGGVFPEKEQTLIRFTGHGKVEVDTIAGPSGQGAESTLALVVSRELGIPYDDITVRCCDPDGPRLSGLGTGGSRAAVTYGNAVAMGSREIIKKGQALAAEDLEVAAQDVEFKDGVFRVAGTDVQIKLTELAKKHAGALDTIGETSAVQTFPGGSHVAEVELDPETGVIELVKYVAADDCGNLIDHTMVEGQLFGGIVQGIGQVFGEHARYDKDGQFLTATFMDYFMPHADLLPPIELIHYPVPSPTNSLGAKGVGETGSTGGLTTTYSAVMDAMRQVGVKHMDMPFTPDRVWRAIQEAKQTAAA